MSEDDKPFACPQPGCGMRFTNEDHMSVHKMKHDMSLTFSGGLGGSKGGGASNIFVDQTPTPTKFLRNCEEIGLFNEINKNPFEEAFKKAAQESNAGGGGSANASNAVSPTTSGLNLLSPSLPFSYKSHKFDIPSPVSTHPSRSSNKPDGSTFETAIDLRVSSSSSEDTPPVHPSHLIPHQLHPLSQHKAADSDGRSQQEVGMGVGLETAAAVRGPNASEELSLGEPPLVVAPSDTLSNHSDNLDHFHTAASAVAVPLSDRTDGGGAAAASLPTDQHARTRHGSLGSIRHHTLNHTTERAHDLSSAHTSIDEDSFESRSMSVGHLPSLDQADSSVSSTIDINHHHHQPHTRHASMSSISSSHTQHRANNHDQRPASIDLGDQPLNKKARLEAPQSTPLQRPTSLALSTPILSPAQPLSTDASNTDSTLRPRPTSLGVSGAVATLSIKAEPAGTPTSVIKTPQQAQPPANLPAPGGASTCTGLPQIQHAGTIVSANIIEVGGAGSDDSLSLPSDPSLSDTAASFIATSNTAATPLQYQQPAAAVTGVGVVGVPTIQAQPQAGGAGTIGVAATPGSNTSVVTPGGTQQSVVMQVVIQLPDGQTIPVQFPASVGTPTGGLLPTPTSTPAAQAAGGNVTHVPGMPGPDTVAAQHSSNSSKASTPSSRTKQLLKTAITQNRQQQQHAANKPASSASHLSVTSSSGPHQPSPTQSIAPKGGVIPPTHAHSPNTYTSHLQTTLNNTVDIQDADTSTPYGSSNMAESDDPDERRRKFLERNRAAAARCRLKRKNWVSTLETKADSMMSQNHKLQKEVNSLRTEVAHLKQLLLAHKDCDIFKHQRNTGQFRIDSTATQLVPQLTSTTATPHKSTAAGGTGSAAKQTPITASPVSVVHAPSATVTRNIAAVGGGNVGGAGQQILVGVAPSTQQPTLSSVQSATAGAKVDASDVNIVTVQGTSPSKPSPGSAVRLREGGVTNPTPVTLVKNIGGGAGTSNVLYVSNNDVNNPVIISKTISSSSLDELSGTSGASMDQGEKPTQVLAMVGEDCEQTTTIVLQAAPQTGNNKPRQGMQRPLKQTYYIAKT